MRKIIPLLLAGFLLAGCTPKQSDPEVLDTPDTPVVPDEPVDPVKPDPTNPDILNTETMYNDLFNRKNRIEIELDFSNKAIKNLQSYGLTYDIKKDMYHPCDMTLKINDSAYFIEEVGARMKGNTSRTNNFVFNDDTFNKNRFLNFKLSFSQTFDDAEDNDYYIREWESKDVRKVRKNRRLGLQKKIDFKWNKNFDNTFTKAAYAFFAYEQEGLVAQKDNIVKMTIKNEKDSVTFLMDMMESVDETFLSNHMAKEDAKGNLYKSLYSSGPADYSRTSAESIGIETPSWTPIYDLKTNDDEPDHTLLTNLISTLNEDKSDASTFKETLDNMVDVDSFLKVQALNWVIGNPDDMRNNYNNYYTYFRSTDNKLMIFPYDLDRCFGVLQDWGIHTENYPYDATYQVVTNEDLRNPLFYRTIITGSTWYGENFEVISEYKNRYEELCNEYAKKYLDVNKFKEFTNDFPLVDKNINKAGGSNITFETYANAKLKLCK